MIPSRHAQIAGDELRQKGQVETHEDNQRREPSPAFGIHAPGYLGPPVMQATQISQQRSPNHDVVEMGDDEVGITQMDVDRKRSEKQSRHAADSKQSNEAERV